MNVQVPMPKLSKKLCAVIGTMLVTVLNKVYGLELTDETVQDLTYLVMVYVGGQSFVDWGTRRKLKSDWEPTVTGVTTSSQPTE